MSLWWGLTAVSQSGLVSLLMGVSAVGLACLGDGILSGVIVPNSIPDDELSPLATRIFAVFVGVGAIAILLISAYLYVGV